MFGRKGKWPGTGLESLVNGKHFSPTIGFLTSTLGVNTSNKTRNLTFVAIESVLGSSVDAVVVTHSEQSHATRTVHSGTRRETVRRVVHSGRIVAVTIAVSVAGDGENEYEGVDQLSDDEKPLKSYSSNRSMLQTWLDRLVFGTGIGCIFGVGDSNSDSVKKANRHLQSLLG